MSQTRPSLDAMAVVNAMETRLVEVMDVLEHPTKLGAEALTVFTTRKAKCTCRTRPES